MAQDPYVYPGTGVLCNNLEIRDPRQLSQAEANIAGLALRALADEPLPGSYDLTHWQAFHCRIFGALYPWAGELRTDVLGPARRTGRTPSGLGAP
jgi:cell filamentation protein